MAKQLSPVEQAKLARIMADPVYWAKAFLKTNNPKTKQLEAWTARDYQEEMLRDPNTRVVYRLGRRCLIGDTRVVDPIKKQSYTIAELYKRQSSINVLALDLSDNTLKSQSNCIAVYSGKQKVYKVTLRNDRAITITDNHPLLTLNGWRELKSLHIGDAIAVPLNTNYFDVNYDNKIEWNEIHSIVFAGVQKTYDLQVPKYNNFVANDIIVHNCGKSETMIVGGLHKATTNTHYRVLYVTPYENQVNLIFMRMRELIADSPLLKKQVVKMKSSPYMIEFTNGSVIMGFTTGAASGSGAASVRGQRAD